MKQKPKRDLMAAAFGRAPLRFPEAVEPMSGETLRAALDKLQINQSEFARLIGATSRAVRAWVAGQNAVPMPVGYLVSLMIKTKTAPEDLKL